MNASCGERGSTGAVASRLGATKRLLPWLALVSLVGACATVAVGVDFDSHASWSGYRQYAWLERARGGSRNPLIVQRARDAIEAELLAKGFTRVDDAASADFVVSFTIGSRERVEVESYPAPYTGPWYWADRSWWGYPYWGTPVDVHEYREGTLAIDVFDAHSRRPVWHGWAKKELTLSDIQHSEDSIRNAVRAVLARFPPK